MEVVYAAPVLFPQHSSGSEQSWPQPLRGLAPKYVISLKEEMGRDLSTIEKEQCWWPVIYRILPFSPSMTLTHTVCIVCVEREV